MSTALLVARIQFLQLQLQLRSWLLRYEGRFQGWFWCSWALRAPGHYAATYGTQTTAPLTEMVSLPSTRNGGKIYRHITKAMYLADHNARRSQYQRHHLPNWIACVMRLTT